MPLHQRSTIGMIADDAHQFRWQSPGFPLVEQHAETVVLPGNRKQHARMLIFRAQLETHVVFESDLIEPFHEFVHRNAHLSVIKHTAQMERFADRIGIVRNFGNKSPEFEQQTGGNRHYAESVGTLKRQDVGTSNSCVSTHFTCYPPVTSQPV